MASEQNLIERVRKNFRASDPRLKVGIGDDAAVLRPGHANWVVTTDAFLEGVHFLRAETPPAAVGYKALARATSDIAAMGALPRYFLLNLAVPENCSGTWLDPFLKGMAAAARQFGMVLAGGDTTKYSSVLVNLVVLGECLSGRAILRHGAKPGDAVCVSGRLGEAELGLRLLLNGAKLARRRRPLLQKQFHPEPRVELGLWLAKEKRATAMIDTSDGLSTDLAHLCSSSHVGAEIWAQRVPVVAIPKELSPLKLDPLSLALHGGEDYELLFTVPQRFVSGLPKRVGAVPITVIGRITRKRQIVLIPERGKAAPLPAGGWDPFRSMPIGKGRARG